MHLMLRLQVQADELEHGYRGWTGMMVHSLYGIDYLHHIQILLFMLPTKERMLIVHHTDYTEVCTMRLAFALNWMETDGEKL